MTNNTGLKFNPATGLEDNLDGQQQSIPTVASDYMSNPQNSMQSPFNLKPTANSPLMQAWNNIQAWQELPEEEKQQLANPLNSYNKWNEGLKGLEDSELEEWEKNNYLKTQGKSDAYKERLWKNQQFVNAFGMDAFKNMPDKNDRDELYKDYLLGNAINEKYGNNSNIEQLRNLTPEGKVELLNSGYKSDFEIGLENEKSKDKDWTEYSLGERYNAIAQGATAGAQTGMTLGTVAGGVVSGGTGTIPGLVIGGLIGWGSGAISGIISPENAESVNAVKRKANNDNLLNKVTTADNDRKKEQSQDEINKTWSAYNDAYRKGRITSDEIDKMFDDIALNGKRTVTDELGLTTQYDYQGSNYYSAFKDTDEFEHFSTSDKLKYIAQTQALAQKYGRESATSILEQDMQNYVSDNQTAMTWLGNSLKNVWVGGIANLANNATALGALGTYMTYSALHEIDKDAPTGEEALANFLKGKDASGDGTDNWFNPIYWNKVDQYNTLGLEDWYNPFSYNPENMQKIAENGDISPYNNVVTAGSEGDFWSWNTLNEAVRMNKFAWSDLLKNLTLGKLVRGATRMAGGVELAPGVLATESTAASQAINSIGSLGVLNASSLGIDAAYGMQTYEEVLRQNNARLDSIIAKETEDEVKKILSTPSAQIAFNNYVTLENERRKRMAGETGEWFPVDETKAWNDYVERVTNSIREQKEALHVEDRQQAENDAANAYAIDASIEHLRMATTNGAFKSYLFDKGTLNALRNNNPYVATTTKDGLYAVAKHATRNKTASTLGNYVWGGFHSNYFDDVTVGYAEGFGIQDYNNYLLQKYNPAAYGSVLDEYVNPFLAGVMGANNSMMEGRSFLDGGIGALGTFFTVSPNAAGIVSHRQRMKEAAEAAKKQGKEKEGISTAEWMSDFINNPILEAYASAKAATRMTEAEVKRVNDLIRESGYSLDNMAEVVSTLNQKTAAREGVSPLEAEDAKDKEAFTLAANLLSIKNSAVVQNAQAEPDKANWSNKKKAANVIGRGLNAMLGIQLFSPAESSFTNAMQSLQDAASIGETDNAEALARQEELVNTFIGLDQNKNALEGMSQEEKVSFAQERLKKNASKLLEMIDKTEELQRKFENSIQAQLHPDLKQQLIYQYALNGRWEDRFGDLEEKISGEREHAVDTQASIIAKYGSMKGFERVKKAQEKRVEDAQKAYDTAEQEAKKENDPTKSIVENARQKAVRLFKKKTASMNLRKEKEALNRINAEESQLSGMLESGTDVISAENILKLNANDRLRMLDDFYRNDYSEAQQVQIDKAKNMLIADGTSINEAMGWVKDAAVLSNRMEDNMEVAKRIMQNPIEANQMQQALINNRKKAVIDYFNDKIVADAFHDFTVDSESTLSQEKVAEKAAGYSTAVLNGMLREIEKQMGRTRGVEEVDDKTLSNLEDGIKSVLNTRDERLKKTTDLDNFIRKTKKVNHTEVTEQNNTRETVTTERELSQNDRKLLDDALDYAAERDIPIEELPTEVMSEEFYRYVEEKNHAYDLAGNPITGEAYETNVGTVENRTNPVSPEYMSGLLKDVVNAFQTNRNKVQEAKADKPTASLPESVATNPVEVNGSKPDTNTRNEEARLDEVDSNDILGLKKNRNNPAPTPTPTKAEESSRNNQILEDASTLNNAILEDVSVLLDEVDKMQMSEATKEKLKDLISSNLSSRAFSNIQELQNRIFEDAMVTSEAEAPLIAAKATALAGLNIRDIKSRKATSSQSNNNTEGEKTNTTPSPLAPTPLIMETRDLDILMNYPIWKDYIQTHSVIQFLQKLSDAWNKETEAWRQTGKQGYLHQSQVVFIYDPSLAESIKDSYKEADITYNPEIDAPILMALEITDKNKHLVDSDGQLITIRDKADNQTKQYQIIGAMPSSEVTATESDLMRATAARMAGLRNRINYNDRDTHVLRYAPQNDTNKYNGTIIKTNIEKVSSHTEEDRIPHATEETPKIGVQQLMDDNLNSATESFVSATEEEQRAYDDAKSQGLSAVRKTNLYKKLRRAFIDRLFKRERPAVNPEDADTKELSFKIQKGTNDSYPKIVLIKKISETLDKNSGRPIIELLKEIDNNGSNAQEVIDSNSRFKRLFNQLSKLKLSSGLFNQAGDAVNRTNYDKAIREFENSIQKTINNNLNIDDMTVRIDVSEGIPAEKTVNIHVYSGDVNDAGNILATLTTSYTGQISQAEVASFLKDLILDNENNTRRGLNDSRFERVKWQVNFEDANTANDLSKTAPEKKTARDNLEDLYDDGIFEMQVTKLAYPSRSVIVGINPTMKAKLYPEAKVEPEVPTAEPTETKANFEAESATGKVDGDTGMRTEAPTKESILRGIPRVIIDTVNRMISDSKERNLSDDGRHYNIEGQLWSRVTSIKYALEGFVKDRFDPNSLWAMPSSAIGNSFDEFGRDVLNGVFNSMDDSQRMIEFENYDNSTAKNYADGFMALKAFEARLLSKGQIVITTGDRENPGHITAKGKLDVTVKGDKTTETKKVRVAGTLDVLAIDNKGNLHIYDFKTTRAGIDKLTAEEKGYDRQLSMYAKFLEEEYGLNVKSINIIPIKVDYPAPSQKNYKLTRPGSNQLEIKDHIAADSQYEAFNEANFQVQKEFSLDRLSDEQLIASYDKMSETEKESIVEAIQDQSDTPAEAAEIKTNDIADAKPVITQTKEIEEEEGGRSKKGKLGRRRQDAPSEETAKTINPNDKEGLLNRLKDLEKACGGPKSNLSI